MMPPKVTQLTVENHRGELNHPKKLRYLKKLIEIINLINGKFDIQTDALKSDFTGVKK
jgi:hypothetical protein